MVENVKSAKGYLRLGDDRDIEIAAFELEKEDVMKFKPLYESLHGFLAEEGFKHPQSDDDKVEDLYWERWTPSGAKEQHMWWRVKREVNDYVRFFVTINFQTLNVTKAEVAYKTKKVNAEKIDLIIRARFVLQWDYDDRFKDSILMKFKKAFFNRVYNEEIDQRKVELLEFSMRLQRLIKGYFEMAADHEAPPTFFPPLGYKEQT